MKFLSVLLTIATLLSPSSAQFLTLPDNVIAGACTRTDTQGRHWAYVAWFRTNESSTAPQAFAVYLKNAAPDAPGTFALQGVARPVSDPAVISTLRQRGASVGDDLAEVDGITSMLSTEWKLEGQSEITNSIQRHAAVMKRALSERGARTVLERVGIAHPAIRMPLGIGWAVQLTVAQGQPVTLEIREHDDATNTDGKVLARVSVNAGAPDVLPAPGAPVQVPDNTPRGDLNIRLRWSVPDDLRRRNVVTAGFNLYRIPRGYSILNQTPPLSWLKANAVKVNKAPVSATTLYDETGAADLSFDKTSFFTDDNERYREEPKGVLAGIPFNDGEMFAYHVVAIDLAGNEGAVSPRGLATACRRIPPTVPQGLKIDNVQDSGTTRLRLRWKANAAPAPGEPQTSTDGYVIYRGVNESLALLERFRLNEQNPEMLGYDENFQPVNPLAVLTENLTPDAQGNLTWLDTIPAPENLPPDTTFWYAIRAIHDVDGPSGNCAVVWSAPSGPAFGILRDREGPAAPTGQIQCSSPHIGAASIGFGSDPLPGADDGLLHFRINCERLNSDVKWARLSAVQRLQLPVWTAPIHYSDNSDTVFFEVTLPNNGVDYTFSCQTGGGVRVSREVHETYTPAQYSTTNALWNVRFWSRGFQTIELYPDDPILPGSPNLVWVSMTAPFLSRLTLGTFGFPPSFPGGKMFAVNSGAEGQEVVVSETVFGIFPVRQNVTVSRIRNGKIFVRTDQPFAFYDFHAVNDLPVAGNACLHQPQADEGAKVQPVNVLLQTTEGTKEYRIYRRVDGGPSALISQGAAAWAEDLGPFQASPNAILATDTTLPAGGAVVSYYGQVLDQHQNPSPLVPLGSVILVKPPAQPQLAPVAMTGNEEAPRCVVKWFGPLENVERFEIHVQPVESDPSALATAFGPDAALVEDVTSVSLTNLNDGTFVPTSRYFMSPSLRKWGQTGPEFTLEFSIVKNTQYRVWVKAVGLLGYVSPGSREQEFVWSQPPPPGNVPWPSRPLPLVADSPALFGEPLIKAVYLPDESGLQDGVEFLESPVDGAAVRLGSVIVTEDTGGSITDRFFLRPTEPGSLQQAAGITQRFGYFHFSGAQPDPNSTAVLWNVVSPSSLVKPRPVLPVVLYRQLISDERGTVGQHDIVQVTPLVKNIAWRLLASGGAGLSGTEITDPLWRVVLRDLPGGHKAADLYLTDPHPVAEDSTYRYYIVQFRADGEIDQIIRAGDVTIPAVTE